MLASESYCTSNTEDLTSHGGCFWGVLLPLLDELILRVKLFLISVSIMGCPDLCP